MNQYVFSNDGSKVHYTIEGRGSVVLVFVHGWLGNETWWNAQKEYFKKSYTVACIDLAGHGKSEKNRGSWTSKHYTEDILAVVHDLDARSYVLIGHSMAGAFALETALHSKKIKAVILVDTLKNMDQLMNSDQAENMLFSYYRNDFKRAVESVLPKFLFAPTTPQNIRERLQREFLQHNSTFAIQAIAPLYEMNIRGIATSLNIPVRAINSMYSPTHRENNERYFFDYDYVEIENSGHYPMLEQPEKFNAHLEKILDKLVTMFS